MELSGLAHRPQLNKGIRKNVSCLEVNLEDGPLSLHTLYIEAVLNLEGPLSNPRL